VVSIHDAHVGTGDSLVQPVQQPAHRDLDLPATAAEPFAPQPPRELSHREFWKREAEESKRQTAEIRAAREREAWHQNHPAADPLEPQPAVRAPKPPVGVKDLGVKDTAAPKERKIAAPRKRWVDDENEEQAP
jgi:hypothetical protein